MAINTSPTQPEDNPVVFLTGTDDYMYTRRFARWLDLDYISMKKKDYLSNTVLQDKFDEPWEGRDFVSYLNINL